MHALGYRLLFGVADGVAPVEAQTPRQIDLADRALVQFADAFANRRRRTKLRAVLYYAIVLPGRGHDLPGFVYRMRAGFLDVYVLSRLTSPNRLQSVPVVRSSDDHCVDGPILQNLPILCL